MSRWSKSWYTLTQRKNLVKHLPLLYRHHFGPHLTWQLILASLQASCMRIPPPLYTATGMHHTMKLWYSVDNPGEVRSTAVYLPSWIPSTLYIRLLAQPYNKYTNMLPLEYQVTPALQLSVLNFELSWKIVTWKDRHTNGHRLRLGGFPTKAQLSTCVM